MSGRIIQKDLYTAKTFTITGAQTNYDVKTSESTLAGIQYDYMWITADVACTLKFNATGNNSITIAAGQVREFATINFTNIFITTTATTIVSFVAS